MVQEFKDFIQKGDVVTIAVGLIMALFFAEIVNALLDGIIMPIISLIFGEPDFSAIGFTVGSDPGTFFSIGLVINAVVKFVAVAFVLFMLVKAYNNMKAPEEADDGPTEVELLTEIRDSLRNR